MSWLFQGPLTKSVRYLLLAFQTLLITSASHLSAFAAWKSLYYWCSQHWWFSFPSQITCTQTTFQLLSHTDCLGWLTRKWDVYESLGAFKTSKLLMLKIAATPPDLPSKGWHRQSLACWQGLVITSPVSIWLFPSSLSSPFLLASLSYTNLPSTTAPCLPGRHGCLRPVSPSHHGQFCHRLLLLL